MTDKQDPPPLPTALHFNPVKISESGMRLDGLYTTDQMRAYALEAIRSHEAERGAQEHAVAAFDVAVSEELPLVSHVHYDSHEICKHFAGEVRKRLLAAEASSPVQADWGKHTERTWINEDGMHVTAGGGAPVQAEAPRCSYPQCTGEQPADGSCCKQPFTSAMADAAERYWRAVGPNAHPLPAQFRWVDCFRAMEAAAPSPKASNPVQAEAPTASNAELLEHEPENEPLVSMASVSRCRADGQCQYAIDQRKNHGEN